jgi:WD40 repeat protein
MSAFSPDGKTLASGGAGDHTVKLWDWADGRLRQTLQGHKGRVLFVAYSPDGKTLASGSEDGTVILWDADAGTKRLVLSDHANFVEGLAFSPDGKFLATGSNDRTVKVRDASTGAVLWAGRHNGPVISVAFSRDGKTLASSAGDVKTRSNPGEVKIWDAETGNERLTVPGRFGGVWCVALSADGKLLAGACLDTTIRLWDTATGKLLKVLEGYQVVHVAFAGDDQVLVWSGYHGLVGVWDPATGEERGVALGGPAPLHRFSISPDGQVLATNHTDGTVRLWRCPAAGLPRKEPAP